MFARYQVNETRKFDKKHLRMEDFAVKAKGFPPDARDPLPIQRWIEQRLGRTIVGVSIGYHYSAHEDKIERLLDQHVARCEASHSASLGVPGAAAAASPNARNAARGLGGSYWKPLSEF